MGILGNYTSSRGGTMRNLYRLMRSTRAATAVEYGLILALIFLAAVSAVGNVANSTGTMWNNVSTSAQANM
jgi:pilus assembly protein Flp/PilA